ncbi:MAG TPA: DUF3182 family protein [Pseudomonas sp.]|nr:DUF3182 family protein [Pseudomonas sp.]
MSNATVMEPGSVLLYPNRPQEPEHERVVHGELARRLAALQDLRFAGDYDPAGCPAGRLYLVPSDTLIGRNEPQRLGLRGEQDLFGGAVPHAFMATKVISHSLLHSDAVAPAGWSADFPARVQGCVLAGFSVFSLADARIAGERLLERGPVRLKPVRATAGRGQLMIRDRRALARALDALDQAELSTHGLVLEEHLEQVVTYSVGQVRVADLQASYHGTQRLTRDNAGQCVYGGSDLVLVRGGFDALLGLELDLDVRQVIAQAQVYDQAASDCFPGFFASRRNYDIARGLDDRGQSRCGVLEQSWRIGGASSAEVAALQAFRGEHGPRVVRAASLELYGEGQALPPEAELLFQGLDAEVGFISKAVRVQPYGDA